MSETMSRQRRRIDQFVHDRDPSSPPPVTMVAISATEGFWPKAKAVADAHGMDVLELLSQAIDEWVDERR